MSALLAPLEHFGPERSGVAAASRAQLRAVVSSPMRASRSIFIGILVAVLSLGMVGVLLLNTQIQQRSMQVAATTRTADDLGYQQAALTAKVEQLRSSSDLTKKAWDLGLRPNPHPVFVQLKADGTSSMVGTPVRVTGSELPDQQYQGADAVTEKILASRANLLAKKKAAIEAAKAAQAQRLAQQKADREARIAAQKAKDAANKAKATQKTGAAASTGAAGGQ